MRGVIARDAAPNRNTLRLDQNAPRTGVPEGLSSANNFICVFCGKSRRAPLTRLFEWRKRLLLASRSMARRVHLFLLHVGVLFEIPPPYLCTKALTESVPCDFALAKYWWISKSWAPG